MAVSGANHLLLIDRAAFVRRDPSEREASGRPDADVEWAEVPEVATAHLGDLFVMATVERREPTAPAQRLGMAGIASLACGQD